MKLYTVHCRLSTDIYADSEEDATDSVMRLSQQTSLEYNYIYVDKVLPEEDAGNAVPINPRWGQEE